MILGGRIRWFQLRIYSDFLHWFLEFCLSSFYLFQFLPIFISLTIFAFFQKSKKKKQMNFDMKKPKITSIFIYLVKKRNWNTILKFLQIFSQATVCCQFHKQTFEHLTWAVSFDNDSVFISCCISVLYICESRVPCWILFDR